MFMEMTQPIAIGEQGGRSFAEVKDCDVRIEKAMFGYRVGFDFKIRPFNGGSGSEPVVLLDWDVDLYYRESNGSSTLIGRMVPSLYDRKLELRGHPSSISRQIDLR